MNEITRKALSIEAFEREGIRVRTDRCGQSSPYGGRKMNEITRKALSIEAFERGSVDFATFDHEAHVYIAWLYLCEYDVATAIARITATLRRVTEELGEPEKYHATITWFYMLDISERQSRQQHRSWCSFRDANCDLFADDKPIWRYYTRTTIASDAARRGFVLPDKVAA